MLLTAFTLLFLLQRGPAFPQAATISGQIQAPDGSPAAAVRVSAIIAPAPGVRPEEGIQYYEAPPPVSTGLSDAQGHYRLGNLPPGRYYIVAGGAGQGTFYPGTPDRDRATIVTVEARATTTLDFKLALPLGGRVSGRITPAPAPGAQELAVLSGVKLEDILDTPIRADGTFEFGHLPKGRYLLNVAPEPPGMPAIAFDLADRDVTSLQFVRPKLHTVSGRIVVERGPLPTAFLAFSTPTTYVSAPIAPDGSFHVDLQAAKHVAELSGMPVGYSIGSVRAGTTDVTNGLVVGNADVSNVVITVAVRRNLAHVRGRIPASAQGATKVQMRGPIFGDLETPVKADGSFEFANVTPGSYTLTLAGGARPVSIPVAVTDTDVTVDFARR